MNESSMNEISEVLFNVSSYKSLEWNSNVKVLSREDFKRSQSYYDS